MTDESKGPAPGEDIVRFRPSRTFPFAPLNGSNVPNPAIEFDTQPCPLSRKRKTASSDRNRARS